MINTVLWDLDGCISDTQKVHSKVESALLARENIQISPEEITKTYSGVRTAEFFAELLEKQDSQEKLQVLLEEKWNQMKQEAEKHIDPVPGSLKLISALDKAGFKQAVVSASNQVYVHQVLETLEIKDFFKTIICGDQISKGKPDPEGFLLAAKRLNSQPEDCVVIEDGTSGMIAAKSAGMKCIGITNNENSPSTKQVSDMLAVDVDFIRNL